MRATKISRSLSFGVFRMWKYPRCVLPAASLRMVLIQCLPWKRICHGKFMVTDWTLIDCDRGIRVATEKPRTIRARGKNVESFWPLHGRGCHVEMPGCCREIDRQLPDDS